MKPELDMPEIKIEFDMPEIKQELKISETKPKSDTSESEIKLDIPDIPETRQVFKPDTNDIILAVGLILIAIAMVILFVVFPIKALIHDINMQRISPNLEDKWGELRATLKWDLIAALFFAALFWLIKWSSEAPPSESELRKIQLEQYSNWRQQVTDVDIEYHVKKQCNRVTNDAYVEMKERIKREAGITAIKSEMIHMGLVAQYAKIPMAYAYRGIPSARLGRYVEAQEIEDEKKFMIWYDKELRAHGFPYPLLFVHFWHRKEVQKNINVAVPVANAPLPISRGDIPPITNVCGGFYFWEPQKINITIIA